jgi:hypothetical protein
MVAAMARRPLVLSLGRAAVLIGDGDASREKVLDLAVICHFAGSGYVSLRR